MRRASLEEKGTGRADIGHGVLHPRDVLLSADEARLTGLGIAQAVERVGVPAQVRPPYSAPERTGGSEWGRRADVFGLAALVHEMLWARRVAATGDEAAGWLTEITGGDLSRLRAVFGRALADDPAARFGTALEFAGALKEAFTYEREPRLPLEPTAAVENAEEAVEKEPDPVRSPDELDLRPPVLPPELADSYRPAPESVLAGARSRSAMAPLAFALVIGAALGFAAGFGVGTWGRSTDQGDLASSDSRARAFTEAEVRLKPDATAEDRGVRLQPDLQPNAPKPAAPPIVGSLLVRSTPPGARVVVDGREYGRTPLTVGNLSRGAHTVRVTRDGYVADERLVTITPAQRAHSVTARLAPERTAPGGKVGNAGNVANAANAAKATAAAKAKNPTNPPGPTNSPGAAPLTVESRPAGAKVFIDGRLVGTTPLVVPGVAVGEHALHLDRDGYQRWSSAVRIVTTERNRVTASLDR